MNARTPALVPAVTTFTFDDQPIRVLNASGDALFVASDACAAIGLTDVSDAVKKLDEDEKGRASIPTLGGMQDLLVVTEAGLYTIILRSRGAMTPGTAPHRFRRYVTAEVLPSIRKSGSYLPAAPKPEPIGLLEALKDPEQVIALLAHHAQATIAARAETEAERVLHSETHAHLEDTTRLLTVQTQRVETTGRALVVAHRRIEEQEPIVNRHRALVAADGAMAVTDAANVVGCPRSLLFRFLRDSDGREPWLYVRPGTLLERPYRPKVAQGLMRVRLVPISRSSGKVEQTPQPLITPLGLDRILVEFPLWAAEQARKAEGKDKAEPDLFDRDEPEGEGEG